MGGNIVLLNASLSNSPSYHMAMLLFNKTFIEKLDKHRRKYLWQARTTDSPCWKSLLKVREFYLEGTRIKLNNGQPIRFWEDVWGNNVVPLCLKFPALYEICSHVNASVRTFKEQLHLVTSRRRLCSNLAGQWVELSSLVSNLVFSDEEDQVVWAFEKKNECTLSNQCISG
ncbi:hypothetical protein BRADI_1g12095v3 [Brachypodium distachyon]|uniref:Reverse transcriptase zinc-binding domain-containing protein n=1 Tax=Brachypodium distachyon TaxID=15368 RepID=A0A2K2DJ31_BRADI|nr:hypothetical protein BRADI_1g12095v3 [Brachypodium distachyon]